MHRMHQLDGRARKMIRELEGRTVVSRTPLCGMERLEDGAWVPFENGDTWQKGEAWQTFRVWVEVPEGSKDCQYAIELSTGWGRPWHECNPQFQCYKDGKAEQAYDDHHRRMAVKPGEKFEFTLTGYWNDYSPAQPPVRIRLDLISIDREMIGLWYDANLLFEAAMVLEKGSREQENAFEDLSCAFDLLDLRNPGSAEFKAGVSAARACLRERYFVPEAQMPAQMVCDAVGHTHIDVAYLWDIEQTEHKAVRSFSTVLSLMERYPEYLFMSSQPKLYDMVRQRDPELFSRIQQAVKDGRWEVEGGMWLEADCNLTGSEALVRQFLYGQRFFKEYFDRSCRVLWLPDVFGYSAALPQIMKQCGIDYFMTTKLSWSDGNHFPHDTFMWRGLDGSEVLTHLSPAWTYRKDGTLEDFRSTYNGELTASYIAGGWQNFQYKAVDNHTLLAFGYGDGGGGATEEMLENARRMQGSVLGLPKVQITHTRPFFEELEKRVKKDHRLPRWSGELYLEFHRGTYTASGISKRNNRKAELLIRETELLLSHAALHGMMYPREEMREIWRDILTLQFHDILPGSAIHKVYEDSAKLYAECFEKIYAIRAAAERVLLKEADGVTLWQSAGNPHGGIAVLDAPQEVTALRDDAGVLYPVQHTENGAAVYVPKLEPLCGTGFAFSSEAPFVSELHADQSGFDTPFFAGRFDDAMRIVSLVDKRNGRELVKDGQALNRLVCYENKPHKYDAWNVNPYYSRRYWEIDEVAGVEVTAEGPVYAAVRVNYRYQKSAVTQEIRLYADVPRIDFVTEAEWFEPQTLVKAHFPVDVFYQEAAYDVQFGNVRRPAHQNTTWDVTRFEVCAHKWIDVSEAGYGVSLLNDCKYGHSVTEEEIALSLIKCSIYPDKTADQGHHEFTYSLYPHMGTWREADTPGMAFALNQPVRAIAGAMACEKPLVKTDAGNVVIEAVKAAEDESALIVRLYENHGARTAFELEAGFDVKAAYICNMLEEKQRELEVKENRIRLMVKPYEIVSVMLEPENRI